MEESARLEYLTQTMLCVKMPDGRILPAYSGVFSNLYEIYDGKVYKRRCGPLHHRKRTKRQSGSSWLIIRSGSCSPP